MATVIFQGPVLVDVIRIVDNGAGTNPRLLIEIQEPADAMGGHGWKASDTLTRPQFEALMLASGVVH